MTIIEVHFAKLPPQRYFLPLAICWENESGEERIKALGAWALARVRQKERTGLLYGAFGDDRFCRALVQGIGDNLVLPFAKGRLEFSAFKAFCGLADVLDAPVQHPALEQSNTAVYFGDKLFLKGYRRLQIGTNPEVEVGRFLTEQSPFPHIVPVAGALEFQRADGERQTLAILQCFVKNQGSAWSFAVDYLQRFLVEQLADTSPQTESQHGYFLKFMDLLGQRTGELHHAFSLRTGNEAFDPETIGAGDLLNWSERLRQEAVATFDELEKMHGSLAQELVAATDQLLLLRKSLLSRITLSSLEGIIVSKMRYHGDYHLGQILRVESDFVITDFEGEPGRTISERHEKHSPIRDVAGMLRSFSYVAAVAANHTTKERPGDRHRIGPLVQAWEQETAQAFLAGYRNALGDGIVLPADAAAAGRLIEFFVIEKALYELRYEMNNRPDWLSIPLFGLIRILDGKEAYNEI